MRQSGSVLVIVAARASVFLIGLVALAVTCGAGAHAARAPQASHAADALDRSHGFALVEIADGIHVHYGRHEDMSVANAGDIANVGFVIGEEAVLVFDPGGSPAVARALRDAIDRVTDLPVAWVVLTHAHPDHVLGDGVFARPDDAPIDAPIDAPTFVAHAKFERARLSRGDASMPRYRALFAAGDPPPRGPDVEVAPGDEGFAIDLGGRRLRAIALPSAHTDHDLVLFDETTRTLIAGDVVVDERLPSLDGSLLGWIAVLDSLDALAPKLVVPGHGHAGGWPDVAAPQRRYLESLRDDTRRGLASGEDLAEAIEAAEAVPPGEWRLFGLHHPQNVTRAWVELEWE